MFLHVDLSLCLTFLLSVSLTFLSVCVLCFGLSAEYLWSGQRKKWIEHLFLYAQRFDVVVVIVVNNNFYDLCHLYRLIVACPVFFFSGSHRIGSILIQSMKIQAEKFFPHHFTYILIIITIIKKKYYVTKSRLTEEREERNETKRIERNEEKKRRQRRIQSRI